MIFAEDDVQHVKIIDCKPCEPCEISSPVIMVLTPCMHKPVRCRIPAPAYMCSKAESTRLRVQGSLELSSHDIQNNYSDDSGKLCSGMESSECTYHKTRFPQSTHIRILREKRRWDQKGEPDY